MCCTETSLSFTYTVLRDGCKTESAAKALGEKKRQKTVFKIQHAQTEREPERVSCYAVMTILSRTALGRAYILNGYRYE